MILVMRRPCIPEDEGRYFYIGQYSTREEADAWLKLQEDQYFRPSDYLVLDLP